MLLRRLALLLITLLMGLAISARGQAGPGGPGGGGAGGFGGDDPSGMNIDSDVLILMQQLLENSDPDLMESMQNIVRIEMQVISNMQNAGEDPSQFFQEMAQQAQDGNFDHDAELQQLIAAGYMTEDMVRQLQILKERLYVSTERTFENTTYARIRQLLKPSDAEWDVLRPKVKRVLDAQAEVAQGGDTLNRGNTILGFDLNSLSMMRGVQQMGGPQGSNTDLGKAWIALQEAAQDNRTGQNVLRVKLDNWRRLHEKARSELKTAQDDLTRVLTLRQETVMIIVGVL